MNAGWPLWLPEWLPLIIPVALALLTSVLVCRPLSRGWLAILDHPNERSLHSKPTPRTGGLAVLAAIAVGWFAAGWVYPPSLAYAFMLIPALAVAGVSLLDDLGHLPALLRLLVHLGAGGALVFWGLSWSQLLLPWGDFAFPTWLAVLVTLLFVGWLINLYNFMDGMDGFAGGMTLFGFGGCAILGGLQDQWGFALVNAVIAVSALGFLRFNFPPAQIFMGDVGSSTLGYLAAAVLLWAEQAGIFPLWIGVLLFAPFIVDASFTLLRRLLRGEKIWQAHREHIYQRLVQLGWGHRNTVLAEYALMSLGVISAVIAVQWPASQGAVLLGWLAVYPVLLLAVHFLERSRKG